MFSLIFYFALTVVFYKFTILQGGPFVGTEKGPLDGTEIGCLDGTAVRFSANLPVQQMACTIERSPPVFKMTINILASRTSHSRT